MSYAGVECDPGWFRWAEQETIARLKDQLSDRRAGRELRRVAQPESDLGGVHDLGVRDARPPAAPATVGEAAVASGSRLPRPSEPAQATFPDHPLHTHVTAFSEPPDRHGPAWHDWAEAQTVLRLQQPPKRKRTASPPRREPVADDLRIEVSLATAPTRTVRVHHENLKAVGV